MQQGDQIHVDQCHDVKCLYLSATGLIHLTSFNTGYRTQFPYIVFAAQLKLLRQGCNIAGLLLAGNEKENYCKIKRGSSIGYLIASSSLISLRNVIISLILDLMQT